MDRQVRSEPSAAVRSVRRSHPEPVAARRLGRAPGTEQRGDDTRRGGAGQARRRTVCGRDHRRRDRSALRRPVVTTSAWIRSRLKPSPSGLPLGCRRVASRPVATGVRGHPSAGRGHALWAAPSPRPWRSPGRSRSTGRCRRRFPTTATRDLARVLADCHGSRVRVVPTRAGSTPAALNRAIAASHGSDDRLRLDAHASSPPGYVAARRASAGRHRCGQRRGSAGADGASGVRRGRGGRHGIAPRVRRRRLSVAVSTPGPVETRLPRCVPARGARGRRWLRRATCTATRTTSSTIGLREAGWTVWFDPRLAVALPAPRDRARAGPPVPRTTAVTSAW